MYWSFCLSLHLTIALEVGVKSSFIRDPNVICEFIGGNLVICFLKFIVKIFCCP
jgi:hypothetical protein